MDTEVVAIVLEKADTRRAIEEDIKRRNEESIGEGDKDSLYQLKINKIHGTKSSCVVN